jgi:hypothetical protein
MEENDVLIGAIEDAAAVKYEARCVQFIRIA